MNEITSVAPLSTCKEKCPSMSVVVPLPVPFCTTVAIITGSPMSSMTVPLASIFCAFIEAQTAKSKKLMRILPIFSMFK